MEGGNGFYGHLKDDSPKIRSPGPCGEDFGAPDSTESAL